MPIRNDSVFLNSPPADWRISIGGVDVTKLVRSLEISKPLDIRTPQLITGEIELIQPINVSDQRPFGIYAPELDTYSINPIKNPDLKAYASIVEIFGEGRVIAQLRLIEDLRYDFNSGTATGRLGHKIQSVVNQESNAVTDFTKATSNQYAIGQSVEILSIGDYCKQMLATAIDGNGGTPFTEDDLDTTNLPDSLNNQYNLDGSIRSLGFEANQDFSGTLDAVIHGVFFDNSSRALEPIPGTERLRASEAYPISQGDLLPRLRLPPTQVLVTIENLTIDDPATVAKVSGGNLTTRLKRTGSEYPYEIITARFASGDPAETTIIEQPTSNEDRVTTRFTRRAAERYLIEGSTASNIIQRTEIETKTYGSQGEPMRREQVFSLTRHELGKLPVPGLQKYTQEEKDVGNASITQGLTITTKWDYDSSKNLRSIAVTYELGRQYVFAGAEGDGKVVALIETEHFENTVSSTINPRWEGFVTRSIPEGLELENESTNLIPDPNFVSERRPLSSLPRPQYREPINPITITAIDPRQLEATVLGPDANPRRLDITSNYAIADESLDQLGQTILASNAQLREVWDVRFAMPSGFDLFGSWDIYHIDNGYEARAIALIGPFLVFDQSQGIATVTYGGTAAHLGELPERIQPFRRPVQPIRYIAPTVAEPNPVIPLQIDRLPATALSASIGVPINPIPLAAYGGTPPYTFSSPDLPAGLSIDGDRIVGTPTMAIVAAVTIEVTDQVPTVVTTGLSLIIGEVAKPTPIYNFPASSFIDASTDFYVDALPFAPQDAFIDVPIDVYIEGQLGEARAFIDASHDVFLTTFQAPPIELFLDAAPEIFIEGRPTAAIAYVDAPVEVYAETEILPEPFSPLDLTSIVAWYATYDLTVGQFSSWTNRALVAGTMGGNRAVQEDGGVRYMDFAGATTSNSWSANNFPAMDGVTAVAVVRNSVAAGLRVLLSRFGVSQQIILGYQGGFPDARLLFGNAQYTGSDVASNPEWQIIAYRGGSIDEGFINGVKVAESTSPQAPIGSGQWRMRFSLSNSVYQGEVAEMQVFSAELSDDDLRKVEGEIAHRIGVVASLDPAHPYKGSPPFGELAEQADLSIPTISWFNMNE